MTEHEEQEHQQSMTKLMSTWASAIHNGTSPEDMKHEYCRSMELVHSVTGERVPIMAWPVSVSDIDVTGYEDSKNGEFTMTINFDYELYERNKNV